MSDEQPLRAAVLASPDDDTPRLVYADHRDDCGDAARAAFIRAQVDEALAPTGSWQQELLRRRYDAHDPAAIGPDLSARFPRGHQRRERGFINMVSWDPGRANDRAVWAYIQLLNKARKEEAPLQGLHVSDYRGFDKWVERHIGTSLRLNLHTLSLENLNAQNALLLMTNGVGFPYLRTLCMSGADLNGAIYPLSNSIQLFGGFPNLTALDLSTAGLAPGSLLPFGDCPVLWNRLISLSLSDNGITPRDINLLLTRTRRKHIWTKLAFLDLSLCPLLGDEAAAILTQYAEHLPALRQLKLGGSNISDAGAAALAEGASRFAHLEILNFASHIPPGSPREHEALQRIGNAGAASLAEHATHFGALCSLDLSGNAIGPEGAQKLAAAQFPNLHEICLDHQHLNTACTHDTQRAFVAALQRQREAEAALPSRPPALPALEYIDGRPIAEFGIPPARPLPETERPVVLGRGYAAQCKL